MSRLRQHRSPKSFANTFEELRYFAVTFCVSKTRYDMAQKKRLAQDASNLKRRFRNIEILKKMVQIYNDHG